MVTCSTDSHIVRMCLTKGTSMTANTAGPAASWMPVLFSALAAFTLALSGCGGKASRHRGPIPLYSSSPVVNTARSQLGKSYVYGGASPDAGFDCSGFTCWVYSQYGVALPRRSFDQFNTGMEISRNEIRAGDLLFFNVSQKGASHVGIYSGYGTFIHCPHPGATVREESFGEAYWQRRYLGARRVLP